MSEPFALTLVKANMKCPGEIVVVDVAQLCDVLGMLDELLFLVHAVAV
jgi:hypothetical protein